MSLLKVAFYALRLNNLHSWSPLDPCLGIISIEIKNQVLKWFIFTWASIVLVPIVKDISEEYCLTAKVTADYNKDQ